MAKRSRMQRPCACQSVCEVSVSRKIGTRWAPPAIGSEYRCRCSDCKRRKNTCRSFGGGLSSVSASFLGLIAIKEAMKRAKIDGGDVDEAITAAMTAGAGQSPARGGGGSGYSGREAAYQINQSHRACARSRLAFRRSRSATRRSSWPAGRGHEPGAAKRQSPQWPEDGDLSFIDTDDRDGLWDAFNGYHMVENVAVKWQITREEQDAFAAASQQKAWQGDGGRPLQGRDSPPSRGAARRSSTLTSIRSRKPRPKAVRPRTGLCEGRHGHGGQCVGHQRRRGGDGPDDGRGSEASRHHAARADRLLGRPRVSTRRSWVRVRSRGGAGARWKRPAGRSTTSTSSRRMKPSRRRPAR